MRFCGIICEYNPFHRGHEKHIALSRRISGAELIICAMSGSFVQRGEAAIFDKWTRAECALKGGADAVIELPLLAAVQSAEGFAQGGVKTLAAAGVDSLCFGAETDDMSLLESLAQTLHDEDPAYKRALQKALKEGKSFPKARLDAAGAPCDAAQPGILLGIEYLKALRRYPHIRPYMIRREGAGYHCDDIDAYLPSATAIRSAFARAQTDMALCAMPDHCADHIRDRIEAGLVPVLPDAFDKALLHILRLNGTEYIARLPDVSEGLENRIYAAARSCQTREDLIARVKTKRYTYARISRILLYALLGITRDMTAAHNTAPVGHIRLLGAKNPEVISALSAVSTVPVITTAAHPYPHIDVAASNVWALTQSVPPFSDADRDYTTRLLTQI